MCAHSSAMTRIKTNKKTTIHTKKKQTQTTNYRRNQTKIARMRILFLVLIVLALSMTISAKKKKSKGKQGRPTRNIVPRDLIKRFYSVLVTFIGRSSVRPATRCYS